MTLRARRVLVALVVLAAAIVLAACATLGAAGLSHAVLVGLIGQDGISAIDDTPPMLLLVGGCYAVGALSGLAAFALGYRRFVRNLRSR
jgi:hypothetical protein